MARLQSRGKDSALSEKSLKDKTSNAARQRAHYNRRHHRERAEAAARVMPLLDTSVTLRLLLVMPEAEAVNTLKALRRLKW